MILCFLVYNLFGWYKGTGTKPAEKKEEVNKVQKSNPFGSAKARDENDYAKKKKETGGEAPFEEIKEVKGTTLDKLAAEKPSKKPEQKQEKKQKEEEFIVAGGKGVIKSVFLLIF